MWYEGLPSRSINYLPLPLWALVFMGDLDFACYISNPLFLLQAWNGWYMVPRALSHLSGLQSQTCLSSILELYHVQLMDNNSGQKSIRVRNIYLEGLGTNPKWADCCSLPLQVLGSVPAETVKDMLSQMTYFPCQMWVLYPCITCYCSFPSIGREGCCISVRVS